MRVNELTRFIIERQKIMILKDQGKPRPWTKDPILDKYRFCNVHREDDRVTKWLRANWYPKFHKDVDYWFTAIVARLFNLPESLTDVVEYTLPFNPKAFVAMLHGRKTQGLKVFNAAYIVSTNGVAMDKVEYVVYNVLNILWGEREKMRPKKGDTLEVYHSMLMSFDGLGSFIAAQVIADLKYIAGTNKPLNKAEDWSTFAASGPGSRRGLNRVAGRSFDSPWVESHWKACLAELRDKVNERLVKADWGPLDAQDLQNCLCEYDKYERARLGTGTPKQLYKEKST